MMFTVTIRNVHDRQLGELVAGIGTKKWSVSLTHHAENQEEKATKKKYVGDSTFISLTGKKATKGSMRERVLETMEKLESRNGIGSVNRGMLKEELIKEKLDTQILYQLVREGYLKKR
jgi:hypothetical protein